MKDSATWIFGRGASVACNLKWIVPEDWKTLGREKQISLIKKQLKIEMDSDQVDTLPYKNLLSALSLRTNENWCHLFITTNWDYLLEKEIYNLGLQVLPKWLCDSFVFHLNGTIEELEDNSNRSPFLIETDKASDREKTVETNIAFNKIAWRQFFIVVGLSFRCEMDKFTLSILNTVEDDLPIGESCWIVVNPNETELKDTMSIIQGYLPRAKFYPIEKGLNDWINSGLTELAKVGIINK